jgi:hypothetical protein
MKADNEQRRPALQQGLTGHIGEGGSIVLKELWAKISAQEKLVVYGAGVVALGVIVGLILAVKSYGGYSAYGVNVPGVSINYFTADNAGLFALLALAGAIATLVVVYLHVAPNMNITWPMPYAQILLIVCAVTAGCAILIVLMQLIRPGGFGPEPPIFLYVADLAVVAGGALLGYSAYTQYMASKAA